jgi:hypothetical protein
MDDVKFDVVDDSVEEGDKMQEETEEKETHTVPLHITGEPHSFVYLDIEFTNNTPQATPISIGACDNSGNTFYGEVSDFIYGDCDDNAIKNVIPSLYRPDTDESMKSRTLVSTRENVIKAFFEWLKKNINDKEYIVQFVSDVPHHDFVYLTNTYSKYLQDNKMDESKAIIMSPDINNINEQISLFLLMRNVEIEGERPSDEEIAKANAGTYPLYDSFNINRYNLIQELASQRNETTDLNNPRSDALYKAKSIRYIHQYIWGYETEE